MTSRFVQALGVCEVSLGHWLVVMSEADSYKAEDESYDQLVAYLDGELDAEVSLKIERRLAEDEDFRREARQLQSAWDMLDELPKVEVSEAFTQSTVEMVVVSAENELKSKNESAQRKNRMWWVGGAGGLIVTAAASFWLISSILARPNEQLVRDLPVIEDFELYRVVDDVDYLRRLSGSGLFDEEVEDAL